MKAEGPGTAVRITALEFLHLRGHPRTVEGAGDQGAARSTLAANVERVWQSPLAPARRERFSPTKRVAWRHTRSTKTPALDDKPLAANAERSISQISPLLIRRAVATENVDTPVPARWAGLSLPAGWATSTFSPFGPPSSANAARQRRDRGPPRLLRWATPRGGQFPVLPLVRPGARSAPRIRRSAQGLFTSVKIKA